MLDLKVSSWLGKSQASTDSATSNRDPVPIR